MKFEQDYCFAMINNSEYFTHVCGWKKESDELYGEYSSKRDKYIRYFWCDNMAYRSEPLIELIPISESAQKKRFQTIDAIFGWAKYNNNKEK